MQKKQGYLPSSLLFNTVLKGLAVPGVRQEKQMKSQIQKLRSKTVFPVNLNVFVESPKKSSKQLTRTKINLASSQDRKSILKKSISLPYICIQKNVIVIKKIIIVTTGLQIYNILESIF